MITGGPRGLTQDVLRGPQLARASPQANARAHRTHPPRAGVRARARSIDRTDDTYVRSLSIGGRCLSCLELAPAVACAAPRPGRCPDGGERWRHQQVTRCGDCGTRDCEQGPQGCAHSTRSASSRNRPQRSCLCAEAARALGATACWRCCHSRAVLSGPARRSSRAELNASFREPRGLGLNATHAATPQQPSSSGCGRRRTRLPRRWLPTARRARTHTASWWRGCVASTALHRCRYQKPAPLASLTASLTPLSRRSIRATRAQRPISWSRRETSPSLSKPRQ